MDHEIHGRAGFASWIHNVGPGENHRTAMHRLAQHRHRAAFHGKVGHLGISGHSKSAGIDENGFNSRKKVVGHSQDEQTGVTSNGHFHFIGHLEPAASFPALFGDENLNEV